MKTTFAYTGIRVKDLEESVKFYAGVLGMNDQSRSSVGATGGQVVSLQSEDGGQQLELNYYPKESKFATSYSSGEALDHLAFKVEDLERALSEAKKLGHPSVLEINSEGGKWAYIEDPNGIYIELLG
jgi:catechol 2,3-dioxygenase-like lactoylglutathione lyase family enzyme